MRIIQFKRGGESALAVRRFSFETLHWDRVADMGKLRQLRGSIDEGGREMFVLASALKWTMRTGANRVRGR